MKVAIVTLLYSAFAAAACTPLLVDDHSTALTTQQNNVKGYTSDDGTCASLGVTNKVLQLTPGSNKCYWYTSFPTSKPEDAVGGHRAALVFTVTPPSAPWSFKVNAKSWNGTNLVDSYATVSGTKGGSQTVQIALQPTPGFNGPDPLSPRNIRSFVYESFSNNAANWQIGPLSLSCLAS